MDKVAPADIRSLEDFKRRIPITDKKDFVQFQQERPPYGDTLTLPLEMVAHHVETSGSTGVPKGVCIPHKAVNRLVNGSDYIALNATDRIAQISNISFDAATFEICGALHNGAALVLIDHDTVLSPGLFAADLTAKTGSIGAAWGIHFANNFNGIALIATDGTITGLALYLTPYSAADPDLLGWSVVPSFLLLAASWYLTRRLTAR